MGNHDEAGKGDKRRKENQEKVRDNLDKIKYGERDKAADNFKIKVNGK